MASIDIDIRRLSQKLIEKVGMDSITQFFALVKAALLLAFVFFAWTAVYLML